MAESYLIDGTNISTYMAHVQTLDGMIGVPPMQQSDFVVPGRTGVVAAKPWAGPRPVVIGGIITGTDRSTYQTNARALASLCFNGGDTVTIKRTLDLSASTTQSAVATARYVSGLESVEQLSYNVGRVAIEFSLLDGYFHDENYTTEPATSNPIFGLTVPGDAPTTKIKIRFSSVVGTVRLTNTTTSDYVQYTASNSSTVELDVSEFFATPANTISSVRAGTASYYWMRLNPGANNFTFTGNGTVQILYKAAYL